MKRRKPLAGPPSSGIGHSNSRRRTPAASGLRPSSPSTHEAEALRRAAARAGR